MGKGQRERYRWRRDLEREPIAVAAPTGVQHVSQPQAWGTPAAAAAAASPSAAVAVHLPSLNYCSEEDENDIILSVLNAAQSIPVDASFEKDEVPIIKKICLPYIGCVKSIQNLQGFKEKHALVRPLEIFGGKMTIQVVTAQGKFFFQAVMSAISNCHSKNKSWNGTFDSNQIRIIKPCHSKEFVMILQVPMEFEGKGRLLQAMANDLRRVAEIFIPLYSVDYNMPAYFLALKEDLEGVTCELLAKERKFMEHLSYHPAIMSSSGRNTFMTKLNSVRKYCNVLRPIMLSKPYPDWKAIVESEIDGKDTIEILNSVYYYNGQPGKECENTVRGLCRFLRNVLTHGKEHDASVIHDYELELYLAKMFGTFLPSIVRTLLDSGKMEQVYGEDWSTYKMSKSNEWEPTWSG